MSGLKVYVDLMSQPCRALTMFLRLNKIPHDLKLIQIKRGDHLDPEYMANIHKLGKAPAAVHNGVSMIETISIIRYLSKTFPIDDHWYPNSPLGQQRVDEFLEWHHIGLRLPLSMFFQTVFIRPLLSGKPPKKEHIDMWQGKMIEAFDIVEDVWLKNSPYLTGDKITVADLIGLCEIDQPRMAGYIPTDGRPKMAAWAERVRQETQPHYSDITEIVEKVINKFGGKAPTNLSQL